MIDKWNYFLPRIESSGGRMGGLGKTGMGYIVNKCAKVETDKQGLL